MYIARIYEGIGLNVGDTGRNSYERALDATRKLEIREFYVDYVKKLGNSTYLITLCTCT